MMEPESSIATAGRQAHAVAELGDTRPVGAFQLLTGRIREGSAFGGKRGCCDVPRILHGKINIDDLITQTMPREDINNGFDQMQAWRVDPRRGAVLSLIGLVTLGRAPA